MYVLGLFLALLIIVTIHEAGHFFTAKFFQVKILSFSIGFGPTLFKTVDKNNTIYKICLFPLGGFVEMFGENEEESINKTNQQHAFKHKPLYQKALIVLAGPLANFILAVFLYTIINLQGTYIMRPIIGETIKYSVAENLPINNEITAINNKKVDSWEDVLTEMLQFIGNTSKIDLTLQDINSNDISIHSIYLQNWLKDKEIIDLIEEIGIKPFRPKIFPEIATTVKGSAADVAGIKPDDVITKINDQQITHWQEIIEALQDLANTTGTVSVLRNQQVFELPVVFGSKIIDNKEIAVLGVQVKSADFSEFYYKKTYSLPEAFGLAVNKLYVVATTSIGAIFKMITGALSVKNISGPIQIANIAGKTLENGLTNFMEFIAFLSTSVAVFNLLPIPVLDGGHLTFYAFECITRREINKNLQQILISFGIITLLIFTVFAIFNDISRLL